MLKDKLKLVPELPGCYLMHDKNGTIIYVGKAKKLKRRLSSYFNREHTGKTKKLVSEIVDFDYIVTSSNILLRDDKTYPYIELTNEKYPRLLVVRNINLKKHKHKRIYGPYPNVYAARKTVNMLNRIYPLRKCVSMPKEVCLYYHIHECLGYCEKNIPKEEIDNITNEIIYFLNGNYDKVIEKIKEEMLIASESLNFEKAKELKEPKEFIFGYYVDKGYISFQVFFLRGGKLVERDSHIHPIVGEILEELEEFISRFYEKDNLKPKEILVPDILENDLELLSSVLDLNVIIPKKGEKRKLGNILNIDNLNRVEIFDNSNIFGSFNVSGMVVFDNGKPNKNEYRKFNITNQKNDDFHTMKEVIYRRYFRLLKEQKRFPDLIIVDGGKSQITAAKEVLSDLNLNIPICGLVKNNKHRTNDLMDSNYNIINIDRSSNVFHLLTRMQDEVHNYTINYHRQIRSKGSIESVLDNISGIGAKRKKMLIKKYGSLKKIKELEKEELESILPSEVANNLYNYLKEMDK